MFVSAIRGTGRRDVGRGGEKLEEEKEEGFGTVRGTNFMDALIWGNFCSFFRVCHKKHREERCL